MTTEIDADGLAVCPFCGNAPVIRRTMQDYPSDDVHPAGQYEAAVHVCCDTCGFELVEEYQSEAIAAWNRRATTRTSEAEPVAWMPKVAIDVFQKCGADERLASKAWSYKATSDAVALYTLPTPASDDQVEAVVAALRDLHAFVGVLFGRGPDAIIPETVDTHLGIQIKIGEIMRRAEAALAAMGSTKPAPRLDATVRSGEEG